MLSLLDLENKYPILYKDNAIVKYGGISCHSGWHKLIDDLSRDLEQWMIDNPKEEPIIVCQIKEKFGGLRFYVDGGNSESQQIIDKAEDASLTICDTCGGNGKSREINGWIHTICQDCYLKQAKEIKDSR